MDTFTTTYRRDYVWPKLPPPEPGAVAVPVGQQCPECGCQPLAGGAPAGARLCAPPQADTTLYDHPCHYLRKLQEKFPFLFKVLEKMPPEDLIARVYRDRLRTTYQVDYCHDGALQPEQYKAVVAAAPVAAGVAPPPPGSAPLPGDNCRPRMKAPPCLAQRGSVISRQPRAICDKKENGGLPTRVLTGRTEYQDGISAVGERIMKERLLYPEDKQKKH